VLDDWVLISRIRRFRDPRDGGLVEITAFAAEKGIAPSKAVQRFQKTGGRIASD
jgi:hypothetical protein